MLAQSRRRAELGLLILAILITGGAYTLASLGQTSSVPANIGPFFAIITALFFVAHIAIRRLAPEADGLLFPLVALTILFGVYPKPVLDMSAASVQQLVNNYNTAVTAVKAAALVAQ